MLISISMTDFMKYNEDVIPDLIRDLPRTLFPRVVKRQALKMLISISMTDFMKYNEDVIPDLIRDLPRTLLPRVVKRQALKIPDTDLRE